MMRSKALLLTIACLVPSGCEEEYTECHPERAPSSFPGSEDREAQCVAVCEHFSAIGCDLGCPYLPDGGLDAGLETSELDCVVSCLVATDVVSTPELSEDAVERALRCYVGAKTCLQIGACSRLCGDDGARVWAEENLCVAE